MGNFLVTKFRIVRKITSFLCFIGWMHSSSGNNLIKVLHDLSGMLFSPPPSNSKQVEQYLLIAVLVLQYYLCIDFLLACVVAKVQHTLLKLTFHQNYENIFRGFFCLLKKHKVLGNMK